MTTIRPLIVCLYCYPHGEKHQTSCMSGESIAMAVRRVEKELGCLLYSKAVKG